MNAKKLEKLGYKPSTWVYHSEPEMKFRTWSKQLANGLQFFVDEEEKPGRKTNLFYLQLRESLPEEMVLQDALTLYTLESHFKHI